MRPTSDRFVLEEPAALAAYLDIALRVLDGPVAAAIHEAHDKARADLREAATILERIRWHLLADAGRPSSDIAEMRTDEAAFARQRMAEAPASRPAIVDTQALQTILRHALGGADALVITSLHVVAGGRSKLTALLSQSGCSTLPTELVLRQDWASAVTGTSVAAEFELLAILHAAGILAPRCFLYQGEGNPLGGAFMLVSRLPGRPRGDIFEPPASPTLALQLATQLGKLHGLPAAAFGHIGTLASRDSTIDALTTRLAEFAAIDRALGQPVAGVERALFEWLETRLADFIPRPDVLVHGDLGWHNLLIDGDELTSLLDWELAHFGNPAEDLGYIKGDIERMVPWPEFMRAYHDAGGPCRSEKDVDFYFVWGMVRLYVLLLQARAGLKVGLVQDVAVARVCADSIPRLVATLSEGLQAILDRSAPVADARQAAA